MMLRQGSNRSFCSMKATSRLGPVICAPSSSTVPPLGRERPAARLSSVLLPQPLGPMMATTSPAATASETSRIATSGAPFPARGGNSFVTPLNSRRQVLVIVVRDRVTGCASALCGKLLPQRLPVHLADGRAGKFGDEIDFRGHLVTGEIRPAVGDEVLGARPRAL